MTTYRLTRRDLLAGATAGTALLLGARAPRALGRGGAASDAVALSGADFGAGPGGWRQSRILSPRGGFDLVGLRWDGATGARFAVRARDRRGRWGRWIPLAPLGAHGPDSGSTASGSEPLWTGASEAFQIRASRVPAGLSAHVVSATAPHAPRALAAQAAPAGAPAIIPRSAWGGDGVVPRAPASYGVIELGFVHHTVNANDYAPEDAASIVLAIAHYHRDANKWNDIGYNFLVDRFGRIYEGRAGGIEFAVIGAQAQGYNSHSTGVAALGTFESTDLPEPALDAIAHLLAWKLPLHGVPVTGAVTLTSGGGKLNRYRYGTPVTLQRIAGHRDGDSTACPGGALYGQLPALRERTAALVALAPAGPGLTLATAASVPYDTETLLNGRLTAADGTPAANAPVEIQRNGSTGWRTIASAVTGSDGAWSALLRLRGPVSLRASTPATATSPTSLSRVVAVAVVPRITAAARAPRVALGRAIVVSGSVRPSGSRVRLAIARQTSGVAGLAKIVTPRRHGARYAATLRPDRPGLYRIVARAPVGSSGVAESPPLFVRVLKAPRSAGAGGTQAP